MTADRLPCHHSVVERFLGYVDQSHDRSFEGTKCWQWLGGKSIGGNRYSARGIYGTFNPGGVVARQGGIRAHVFSAWITGLLPRDIPIKVPKGMNLDHRCVNSICVNPLHMELVTAVENQIRRLKRINRIERNEDAEICTLFPLAQEYGTLWLVHPTTETPTSTTCHTHQGCTSSSSHSQTTLLTSPLFLPSASTP